MKKISWMAKSAMAVFFAASVLSSCSKDTVQPDEERGPTETIVLPMMDVSNNEVGSLYIDNMNGKAQARISMKEGYYTVGTNMKTNATLTTTDGTTVYANCTDLDGKTGKCSTYPITRLNNNTHASFSDITTTKGIVFNIMDGSGNVVAKSGKHSIAMHQ